MIHPVISSDIPESTVIMSKVYPLVRELAHKYKLKVVGKTSASWNSSDDFSHFYMARDDGMVIGMVGINREGQYTFRTVTKAKERGRTREDKMTYAATKVASLMRSIEKNQLLPESTVQVLNQMGHVRAVVNEVVEKYSNVSKHSMLNGLELHDLLKVVFNYQNLDKLPRESIDRFKKVLDTYDEVDKTRQAKLDLVKETFGKPIKFLMYDRTKTFIKGTMKISVGFHDNFNLDEVVIDEIDCKRVRTFMDDADIAPLMTMFKVKVQQDSSDVAFVGEEGFFPACGSKYVEELGIVKLDTDGWRYDNYPGKPQWIFFV